VESGLLAGGSPLGAGSVISSALGPLIPGVKLRRETVGPGRPPPRGRPRSRDFADVVLYLYSTGFCLNWGFDAGAMVWESG